MNFTPSRKVGAGALAGAFSVILAFAIQQVGFTLPAEVSSAMTTIISFVTSWFVTDQ